MMSRKAVRKPTTINAVAASLRHKKLNRSHVGLWTYRLAHDASVRVLLCSKQRFNVLALVRLKIRSSASRGRWCEGQPCTSAAGDGDAAPAPRPGLESCRVLVNKDLGALVEL